MKRTYAGIALLGIFLLSACMTSTEYKGIKKGVRLAITYEDSSKKEIVRQTIEMFDKETDEWFEAKKTADGSYTLTAKGSEDKAAAQADQDAGGDDGGGGGGGGGC